MDYNVIDSGESDKYSWEYYHDIETPFWLLRVIDLESGKEIRQKVDADAIDDYKRIKDYGIDECVECSFTNLLLSQEEIEYFEAQAEEQAKEKEADRDWLNNLNPS